MFDASSPARNLTGGSLSASTTSVRRGAMRRTARSNSSEASGAIQREGNE
jgi:hypothetical protein